MNLIYYLDRLFSLPNFFIKDKTLSRRVKISTIIHVVLLVCLVIFPFLFPARYRYNRSTIHTVQLVSIPAIKPRQPAVAKPVVKEPTKKTTAKPKPRSTPKPIAKPLTTPTLEEKLSKRLEETKWEEPSPAPQSAPQFTTSVSTSSNFPFQYYLDLIHDKISSCWYEPQMVLDKQYTAIITFTIMQDGSIRNIHIKKGSGISNFDQSGIRAIELARPFPQLPQGFSHSQLTVNVVFNLK